MVNDDKFAGANLDAEGARRASAMDGASQCGLRNVGRAKARGGQNTAHSAFKQSGFTLIEIMVVLVLVSIISIGSYALLDTFNATDRALEGRAEELRRLSMALYRIDDDLRQLTVRPVKNAYTGYEPALRGDADEIEFTRLGAANLTGEPRGELQRVSYSLGYPEEEPGGNALEEDSGGLFLRSRWRVLDRGPDSEPVAEPLLAGVDALTLRYYDPDTETWLSQWPPASSQTSAGQLDIRLPQALELVLMTRTGGELRRVFPVSSPPDKDAGERGENP